MLEIGIPERSLLIAWETGLMWVRREEPGDEAAIRAIHDTAFRRPERPSAVPPEVRLLDELRTSSDWLPRLSLVAVIDDHPVGHVVCTRAHVGETEPVLALGPIAVEPALQNRGVGQALMHAVIGAADALDEPLIGLLGSPSYYSRFGFRPAASAGIRPPDPAWGDHFQVRLLSGYRPEMHGRFRYAPALDRL